MKRTRPLALALALFGLCAVPALAVEPRDLMLQPNRYAVSADAQPAAVDPAAPAVILLDARQDDWLRRGAVDVHRTIRARRVKLLRPEGAAEARTIVFSFDARSRADEMMARVLTPGGAPIDISKSIVRTPGEARQTISVTAPPIPPGAVVELHVSMLANAEGDFGVDPFQVGDDLPVLESRYVFYPPWGLYWSVTVRDLPDAEIKPLEVVVARHEQTLHGTEVVGATGAGSNMAFAGGPESSANLTISELPGEMHLQPAEKAAVWTFANIPALPREPHRPLASATAPALFVSSQRYTSSTVAFEIAESWGGWGGNLHKAWNRWIESGHANATALAREVAEGKGTAMEKFVALRAAIRERVRVEGISAHPRRVTPDETLRVGVGTTADVAGLAVAMLRSVGVDADLAVARRREDGGGLLAAPAPSLFCDALVRVGGDEPFYWSPLLDGRPGDLPPALQGVQTLTAVDGAAPEKTPFGGSTPNRVNRTTVGVLAADGGLSAETTFALGGLSAETWKAKLAALDDAARREAVRPLLPALAGAKVVDVRAEAVEGPKVARLVVKWRAADAAKRDGAKLLLPTALFEPVAASDWSADARRSPLDLGEPGEFSDTIQLELPKNLEDLVAPDPVQAELEGLGVFEGSCDDWSEKLVVRRKLRLDGNEYAAKDYPAIRDFFRKVAAFDGAKTEVVLQK